MTTIELTLAIAALLITPGPTNTLLALGGAEGGLRRALRLIPAELSGYLATVVPLALFGGAALDAAPAARPVVTAAAALWVAWLAIGLWRLPAPVGPAAGAVDARKVFVTTLLNPKALIFGLVLLPAGPSLVAAFANFAAQIVLIATLWAGLGQMLRRTAPGDDGLPHWLRRTAAFWLGLVAAGLAMQAVAG